MIFIRLIYIDHALSSFSGSVWCTPATRMRGTRGFPSICLGCIAHLSIGRSCNAHGDTGWSYIAHVDIGWSCITLVRKACIAWKSIALLEIDWIARSRVSCATPIMSHQVRGIRKPRPLKITISIRLLISRSYPAVIFGGRLLGTAAYSRSVSPILIL